MVQATVSWAALPLWPEMGEPGCSETRAEQQVWLGSWRLLWTAEHVPAWWRYQTSWASLLSFYEGGRGIALHRQCCRQGD